MEKTVLRQSMRSSILSSTTFPLNATDWGTVINAGVKQLWRIDSTVAQGHGKFNSVGDLRIPPTQKKMPWWENSNRPVLYYVLPDILLT